MNPRDSPILIDGRVYIDAQSLLDWLDTKLKPYKGRFIHRDVDGNVLREEEYISADGRHYDKFRWEILKRMEMQGD